MLLITYQHRPVALAGTSRFYLAPEIAELADLDPLKTFVCFLGLYARDVQIGAIPGDPTRYHPIPAERYAREALIPSPDFTALQDQSDHQLAAYFGVPPEQIRRRREDFAGRLDATTRRPSRRNARSRCGR